MDFRDFSWRKKRERKFVQFRFFEHSRHEIFAGAGGLWRALPSYFANGNFTKIGRNSSFQRCGIFVHGTFLFCFRLWTFEKPRHEARIFERIFEAAMRSDNRFVLCDEFSLHNLAFDFENSDVRGRMDLQDFGRFAFERQCLVCTRNIDFVCGVLFRVQKGEKSAHRFRADFPCCGTSNRGVSFFAAFSMVARRKKLVANSGRVFNMRVVEASVCALV